MENISFVLWVCLWPVACSISGYFSEKKRIVSGGKKHSDDAELISVIVNIVIWVAIGKIL